MPRLSGLAECLDGDSDFSGHDGFPRCDNKLSQYPLKRRYQIP
jgi:hypothetical protein